MQNIKKYLATAALCALLTACGAPDGPSTTPPKYTGVKIGKPYSVSGKWYTPQEDPYYDKTGTASWYGPGFHGKMTANGETFNQHDLTAAHPTLPMPSFVRVTNLQNNRQAIVRINDRGPFHSNRIIDLSKAAAEKLGIQGLGQVRIQFLKEETDVFIASKGTIWPEELQPTQMAEKTMPREEITLTAQDDAKYYHVESRDLEALAESKDFKPAPLEVAKNTTSVSESVPILSVRSSDVMPKLVKPAMADEAPYPSALKQPEPKYNEDMAEDNYGRDTQKITTVPAPENAAHWAFQVASFSERLNAETLAKKLTVIGQPELQPVLVDGKQWFRVYLHPANSNISKEALLSELQNMGLRDARVVVN